jgi:hypothetical protein
MEMEIKEIGISEKTLKELRKNLEDKGYKKEYITQLEEHFTHSELLIMESEMHAIEDSSFDISKNLQENLLVDKEYYDSFELIINNFKTIFEKIIIIKPQFKKCKPFNIHDINEGDYVGIKNYNKSGIIITVLKENNFIIKIGTAIVLKHKDSFKQIDFYSNKLASNNINEIYTDLENEIADEDYYNPIYFFTTFCDFFKIEGKEVFDNIAHRTQQILIEHLAKSGNIIKELQNEQY